MLVLRDPCVWRAAIWSPRWWRLAPWVSRLRLAASAGRVAMILWLMYGELFKKDHLREYCTFVRLLTVALFMVIVLRITFSSRWRTDARASQPYPGHRAEGPFLWTLWVLRPGAVITRLGGC